VRVCACDEHVEDQSVEETPRACLPIGQAKTQEEVGDLTDAAAVMESVPEGDRFEVLGLLADDDLGGEPFDRGRTVEADDAFGVIEDVLGVLGVGDRPAVAQAQNLGVQ